MSKAQVPQGFNYQAILKDGTGKPITGQSLSLKIGILNSLTGGTLLWEEQHSVTPSDQGLISVVVGKGARTGGDFQTFSDIDWAKQPLFLSTSIQYPSTTWIDMGTAQIWAVPYSLVAKDIEGPINKLTVTGNTVLMDEPLFEVKNKNGQTVFAVYNEGVRIYVEDGLAKSAKGGFAVGGFGTTKAEPQDYFIVTKDSVRMYFDSNPGTKSSKGGFAVGGFGTTKGIVQNYLDVSADSIRMYIDNKSKSAKGGFAVGGFGLTKGENASFMNISTDATGTINPSENRILWYPLKNAFLVGKVLIISPDSVGTNSLSAGYETKAAGDYSQALGYKSEAKGDYSTAIGKNAKALSLNSFAFGSLARASNEETYAFGVNSKASGRGSVAIGFNSNASGQDAFALGAGAETTGIGSFALGFIGRDSANNTTGNTLVSQNYGVAIGMGAQALSTPTSNRGAFSIGIQTISDGNYSFAFGYRTRSSGWYSLSTGYGTNASGNFSTSMGYNSTSSGSHSFSAGQLASATEWYAVAIGLRASAEGQQSMALGAETRATGNFSLAAGKLSRAYGPGAVSIGFNNEALDYATSLGYESVASGTYSTTSGFRTAASGNSSFAAGNLASATGISSIALGTSVKATGDNAFASGILTEATGLASTATGMLSKASGSYSFAAGYQTVASGTWSAALGQYCQATAWNTFAMGGGSIAEGYLSTAFGLMTQARPFASFVIGQYNDVTTSPEGNTQWVSTDPLFIAGNGISTGTKSNALTLYKNGNMTISGSLTQNSDLRLKENILPILDATSLVEKINPVYFYFINKNIHPDERQVGLIAQEVKEVIPELVSQDLNGFLSVDYGKMSAILIQAFKEQKEVIENIRSENEDLRLQVAEMKEEIEKIGKLLINYQANR